jgi:hypothetical protein
MEGHILFVTEWERTPEQEDVCDVLQEIARETGTGGITLSKRSSRIP